MNSSPAASSLLQRLKQVNLVKEIVPSQGFQFLRSPSAPPKRAVPEGPPGTLKRRAGPGLPGSRRGFRPTADPTPPGGPEAGSSTQVSPGRPPGAAACRSGSEGDWDGARRVPGPAQAFRRGTSVPPRPRRRSGAVSGRHGKRRAARRAPGTALGPGGSRHGPQEAVPAHRRYGQEDPRVPGAEEPAAGLAALRPGLRDDAAAADSETVAGAGLGGRAERKPALRAALPPAALRRGPHRHPQVLAVGVRRALLLGHHQGEGGLHGRGNRRPPPPTASLREPPEPLPAAASPLAALNRVLFSLQNMDHGRAWGYLTFRGKTGVFSHTRGGERAFVGRTRE